MSVKIVFNGAGISDAKMSDWQRTHQRYNRLHMPLEGRAIYRDMKEEHFLCEGMAYLLVNSYSPNFELFHGYRYKHLYVDFRTIPPLQNHDPIEVHLSDDPFFLYLLKAIQTLLQEHMRLTGGEKMNPHANDETTQQIKRILQVMLTHLQTHYKLTTLENPKIDAAIKFIEAHYAEQIKNEDIAEAVHIDTRYLIRLFTKHMEMAPYQYLTQCRIEHSLEELRSGKSVTETAFACGYQSENAFRLAFKKVMGCAPKAVLNQ